ncbi:hypothetical protein [Pseudonocardia zijingensis]|uniref:hypothetical protein n=1 Tax=Pseudonocardia zijingensis TaxID=153376 RepID=UPI0031DB505C
MSELVTDLDWLAATRYPEVDEDWGPAGGRHAYSEDAALTPIFHALTRGGWRSRQHEPAASTRAQDPTQDPVDEFRRDPLTAPIPVQALATPTTPRRRRELPETGRHHRGRETGRTRW